MKRLLCWPEQHLADKVFCILMAAAHLFLLTGTVILLRINHRNAAVSRLWEPPSPERVWWCPALCTESLSLQEPTFLVFCPRAAVVLILALSLQPLPGSLKHAGQRPTSLDMVHTLSWDASSVWAADESVQISKHIKKWNVRFWLHHILEVWRWKGWCFCHYSLLSLLGVFYISAWFFPTFTLVTVK